ncbi:MAG: TraM recognition domain-containing protein [Candidatus Comchoanobacterales bacterium]
MRGLDSSTEKRTSQIVRDTRSLTQRLSQFLHDARKAAVTMVVISLSVFIFTPITDIVLLVNLCIFIYCIVQHDKLPFRMPQRSHKLDYNDLNPLHKPQKARGIYFIGNELKTNKEIWFTNEDMRTHVLIFGSTGSGKTVMMVSMAYNALVQASGFIYVDGKGDNSLYANIFSMVRSMGRDDDLLLLNFMTGARDIVGPQEKRISNTINPFSHGSSSMLANLVTGMMDSSSSSGDGDMWKGRAIAFVEALLKVLVAMRDAGHILLDANTIRNYFSLDRLEAMVADKTFIRDGQYAISTEFLPDVVMQPMTNYLATLPGYNKERKGRQVSQVFEQHGYITMQLTRIFTSLADTYGHIMRHKLAEIDMRDVVLNRRILVTLLPALEKSPDELANLGKVVIATLRSMMATGLGDSVEGTFQDLILTKPTNAETPFLCILDEYGYYAVKGFAVVPAQARSLGFACVFAGQDLPAFQKASKEEAASIGANTNIKICMKLEDPTETWEFFMKGAGESYVTTVDNFSTGGGNITNTYMDSNTAKTEKRSRIDLLDLKDQGLGEMHIFFKSDIVRAKTFYANPKPVKAMRLNQCLKVDLPKDQDLYTLVKGIEDFEVLIKKGLPTLVAQEDSVLTKLFSVHEEQKINDELSEVERSINTLIQYYSHDSVIDVEEAEVVEEDDGLDLFAEIKNIFSTPEISDQMKSYLRRDQNEVQKPLLIRKDIEKQARQIMQHLGVSEQDAKENVAKVIHDMSMATSYVLPVDVSMPDRDKVPQITKEWVSSFLKAKDEHSKNADEEESK